MDVLYRERQNGLYIWRHIWLVGCDASFLAPREGGGWLVPLYGRRLGGMILEGMVWGLYTLEGMGCWLLRDGK